jgi:hypothetical protein
MVRVDSSDVCTVLRTHVRYRIRSGGDGLTLLRAPRLLDGRLPENRGGLHDAGGVVRASVGAAQQAAADGALVSMASAAHAAGRAVAKINCRSVRLRSARESFSQSSRPCGRGAVRFLLWWLLPPSVTTRQRRSSLRRTIPPLQRVLPKGCRAFLSERLEETFQLPLAKPFGFDPGRQ